ncbi:antitoxin [Streptomyces sp. NPDC057460]|uniref:antitoxin n=1 Tax=Streptomyces sp. NPDC057460 TaxID=3346141 RepID=UPI0036A37C19
MSMMDKIKHMLKGHEDQAGKGIDKAGDTIDDRTQGKYTGQVDTAQDRLKGQLGSDRGQDQPPQPPQPPRA